MPGRDYRKEAMIRTLRAAHNRRRAKSDREDAQYAKKLQEMSPAERQKTIIHHNQLLSHDLARGKQLLGSNERAYADFAQKRRAGLAFPLEDGRIRSSQRTYTPDEWIADFGS